MKPRQVALLSVSIDHRGSLPAIRSINLADRRVKVAIRRAWFDVGDDLVNHVRADMRRPKTGLLYPTEGRRRQTRASAAGEAPAVRTGKLFRSVNYQVRGWRMMSFGAGNRTDIQYATYLEDGTRNMKPRPFMQPAVDATRRNVVRRMESSIQRELNR